MLRLITMFTALVMLAGCASTVGPRESTGTLLGAGTGALLGSQIGSGQGRIVATAAGTLLGALIGQDVGRSLDRADQAYLHQTTQESLESSAINQPSTWVNPDTGHSGSVTPTSTYQASDGRYCREFTQTVEIGGEIQQAYGTACRQPDGSWQMTATQPQTQVRQVVVRERVVEPVYRPASYPTYRPFTTSLSFYWVEHSGRHYGRHHGRHHGRHRW